MIELLRARRSIRKYDSLPIEPDKVEVLKEALLRSPSSRNINPWKFLFVDDPSLLRQLSQCKPHGAEFLEGAPLGIVICGDTTASDTWIEDCSIAAILVQMTAQSLGLGSCWVQVRLRAHDDQVTSEQYVQRLLGIPEQIRVECLLAVGYPAERKRPIRRESLDPDKVRTNRY
jgi:nitroreductase